MYRLLIPLACISLSAAFFGAVQRSPLESATIEGHVVSANSGKPIAGAFVNWPRRNVVSWDGFIRNVPGVSTTTDRDGRFQLSGLDPGSISIGVLAGGFE